MKFVLLSVLAAIATFATADRVKSGQLFTIDPNSFNSNPHIKLARTVQHLGVLIIDGSKSNLAECIPTAQSVTYGFYSASRNAMVLCTANGSIKAMNRTFVHETMHMVQDCRAGLNNYSLKDKNSYLTKLQYMGLNESHKQNIHELYHGESKVFEVEARKLEDSPNIVWKYLVKYCR